MVCFAHWRIPLFCNLILILCTYVQSIAVPEADQYLLLSYSFDDLSLTEEQTVLASIRMFMDSGLLQNFRIDTKVCTLKDVKVVIL